MIGAAVPVHEFVSQSMSPAAWILLAVVLVVAAACFAYGLWRAARVWPKARHEATSVPSEMPKAA